VASHKKWLGQVDEQLTGKSWKDARNSLKSEADHFERAAKTKEADALKLTKQGGASDEIKNLQGDAAQLRAEAATLKEKSQEMGAVYNKLKSSRQKWTQSKNTDLMAAIPETSFFRTKRGKIVGALIGTSVVGAALLGLFTKLSPDAPATIAPAAADTVSKEVLEEIDNDTSFELEGFDSDVI
jgi:hypothetical protein